MSQKTDIPPPFIPSESEESLKGASYVAQKLSFFPTTCGVYRMLDEKGKVLYVGKAKNLKKRLESYAHPERQSTRIAMMIAQIARIEILSTATESEAFLLENDLIKKLKPHYNILLRDDKTFPHILITDKDDFPRILKHRGAKNKPGSYFGPFASARSVNDTILVLQKAFLLRSCSDNLFKNRSRPCLMHQIKRCCAPCAEKITQNDYQELVRQIKDFMNGKNTLIQEKIKTQMQQESDLENFEQAAVLRDRLKALNTIQSQGLGLDNIKDCDVIAAYADIGRVCIQVFFYQGGRSCGNHAYFFEKLQNLTLGEILEAFIGQFYTNRTVPKEVILSHTLPDQETVSKALKTKFIISSKGIKKHLLERALMNAKEALIRSISETKISQDLMDKLTELVDSKEPITRIEVYDNSHIQGTSAIGGMIVAGSNGFEKKSYRKFNIQNENSADDPAMMKEVLTRRFKKSDSDGWELPQLILIDGGKTQLNAALSVLDELGISSIIAVGVAKGEDRNAGRETLYFVNKASIQLAFDDPILHYIQRLRDEAHRFAIGVHRTKRKINTLVSGLDQINGIGSKRKKALLQHFGSFKALQEASVLEIKSVAGISLALAQKIHSVFNKN